MSKIIHIDDFTQGPIDECLIDGGQSQRSNYWENLKTLHSGMEDVKSHYVSTLKALDEIQDESTVVLWIGDSAHDILASAWLLSYFSEKNFNWKYMDLKSVTSGSENILVNVAMLSPRNIYKLYVNIRNMDADKILIFKNIWKKLASENSAYRIYENGKVLSVPEDYHDTIILSFISKKEQLLGKLMGTIMGHSEHRLSDTTIESRLFLSLLRTR